ncbi:MAG: (2Fe-2S)-binding protein [Bacillota bacterium]
MRIHKHPILETAVGRNVTVYMDGRPIAAREGDSIASALIASGISIFRHTHKTGEPRGLFCGIGQCTDCVVIVDGQPNVRSCVTLVKEGMRIQTQQGRGQLGVTV